MELRNAYTAAQLDTDVAYWRRLMVYNYTSGNAASGDYESAMTAQFEMLRCEDEFVKAWNGLTKAERSTLTYLGVRHGYTQP